MDISQYSGKALRQKRIERGLTIEKSAHLAGVSRRSWIRWEKGDGPPSLNNARKIVQGFVEADKQMSRFDSFSIDAASMHISRAVLQAIIATGLDAVPLTSLMYVQRVYEESQRSDEVPFTPSLVSLLLKVQAH